MSLKCLLGWHHWESFVVVDYRHGDVRVASSMHCTRPGCRYHAESWTEISAPHRP